MKKDMAMKKVSQDSGANMTPMVPSSRHGGDGPKTQVRMAKKAFGSSVNLGKSFDNHEKCMK